MYAIRSYYETVLRLVEHGGSGPFDNLVGDLLPAMGREAVHHDRILPRHSKQVGIDAVTAEGREAFAPLLFLPHARPNVGVQDVRVSCRLDRIPQHPDVPLSYRLRLPADPRGRLVPLRACDA